MTHPVLVACPSDELLACLIEGQLADGEAGPLRAHLLHCVECRTLAASLVGDAPHASLEDTLPLAGGTRFPDGMRAGRYELAGILGTGAMGVVYAGFDPELERQVAVKLLRISVGADERGARLRDRFIHESRRLARVVHPNVVTVYDVGEADDRLFIAMELVEGGTLRDWMRAGPRSLEETLRLFEEIGRGLEAIHRAGLVHRDFKPENVLIGADGRPRVSDFGVARLESEMESDAHEAPSADERSLNLTRSGELVGTPAYMAPEQLRAERADARSDLFSFCVAMWESLHGARPFAGLSVVTLEEAIRTQEIMTPTRRPRSGPLAAVTRLLRRGLAADPAERFPTITLLLDELRALQRPVRRGRRAAAIVGATLALAGAGIGGLFAYRAVEQSRCDRSMLSPAWARLRPALETRLHAAPDGLREWVLAALDGYALKLARTGKDSCEATFVDRRQSAQRFDAELECLARREHRMELVVEGLLAPTSQFGNAPDLVSALEDPASCRGARPLRSANADERRALALQLDSAYNDMGFGRLQKAEDGFVSTLAWARRLDEPSLVAESLFGRAQALLRSGKLLEAQRLADEGVATAIAGGAFTVAQVGVAVELRLCAELHCRPAEADRVAAQYGWLAERVGAGRHASRNAGVVARVYTEARRFKEAETIYWSTLALPGVAPDVRAELGHGLGVLLNQSARLDESAAVLAMALVDAVAAYGPESTQRILIEQSLAFVAYSRVGAAAAAPLQEVVVARIERIASEHTVLLVDALANLSEYRTALHERERALDAAERARTLALAKLAADDPSRLNAETIYADCLIAVDRVDTARSLLEAVRNVLDPKPEAPGDRPLSLSTVYFNLARTERHRDVARAKAYLLRAHTIVTPYVGRADVESARKDMAELARELGVTLR